MNSGIFFLVLVFSFGQGTSQIFSDRGCVCKDQWSLLGVVYFGCENPDDDANGPWCFVQSQDCPFGKPGEIVSDGIGSGEFFDYCTPENGVGVQTQQQEEQQQQEQQEQQQQPQESQRQQNQDNTDNVFQSQVARSLISFDTPNAYTPYEVVNNDQVSDSSQSQFSPINQIPTLNILVDLQEDEATNCQQTVGGCDCLSEWQFGGNTQKGCQNLDSDSRGSWCMVKNGENCAPTKFVSDGSQGTFDYCQPNCEPIVDEAGSISSEELIIEFEGPCSVTRSGCECLVEWTYDGDVDGVKVAYYGCAKTLDDQSDPWCPIVASDSCVTPPHSAQLGGNYSSWDYCQPKCQPPTQGSCDTTRRGCKCQQFWNYDGVQQQGCTRPDLDASNTWCVIEPETCTGSEGPTGQLPSTQEFWDFCDPSCQ
eukprot:TRINITY_DN25564_c0_g1_i2.p1 TRINITY_DN25564_c0_g1~~TRINITY_DN25564_c0_g1_i2.p1  ORF type:complete len:422 (-),score=49.06 TRINITY_DN25564_c0_g1_i2:226-1491(-)